MNCVDPRRIHAKAIKTGTKERSFFNNLISLYSKSKLVSDTLRLFTHHILPSPNVVSWTSLISAHSPTLLSLQHFISMLRHPTLPNQRTLASLLKTCASLPSLSFGLTLHSLSIKLSLQTQPFSSSALIHFYSKTRHIQHARKVFDEMPYPDQVCFSSIIVALAQNSLPVDALDYFTRMRGYNLGSTMYSLSAVLKAVGEVAALEDCRMIHAHAVVVGFDSNVIVGTALIDGYGKCGVVASARVIYDELKSSLNVIGWNAMLAGYSQQGDTNCVMDVFIAMEARGFVPDEYSFLAILTAFCNAGLGDETEYWFRKMKLDYGLEPQLEHYTCLVGAMGRCGRLEDAERIAMTMPYKADAAVWRALLSTCAYHGAADMAREMSNRLLELNQNDDSAYVITANVFAGAGRWDEVKELRKLMKSRRVRKEGGMSWIEIRGQVHVFLAGDRAHERNREIYAKADELMEEIGKMGYVPVWDEVLHEVQETDKREALWYHSEKLAVAFGLVSGAIPPGKAIRVVKNLRICRDCHQAFKYISKLVAREILVRDVNRYHRFLDGTCTCRDYW